MRCSQRQPDAGFFTQRYVKRHAIATNRIYTTRYVFSLLPKSDRLQASNSGGLIRTESSSFPPGEIASAQQVNMPPGHNRAVCDTPNSISPLLRSLRRCPGVARARRMPLTMLKVQRLTLLV